MKQSELFFKTRKETPADADSINASYLIRAGFVQKHIAGAYAFMPLGLKVLRKIETIVREEMNKIGGQEILMNIMQPKELWQKTGRWEEMNDVLFKSGSESNQVAMAATHEEQVTTIVKNYINSYKDLPKALYQIQTKLRNEPRAKSGLLRGREFQMKDMYSFHATEEDFEKFYEESKKAYLAAYKRMGLEARIVEASGGVFTKKHSHEFQVFTEVGEDIIYYCDKCEYAVNKEIAEVKEGDKCPKCDGKILMAKGIEVGNIFPLETKYSSTLEAKFLDKDGKEQEMVMGCYGIGLSRVLGTIVEVKYDASSNKMIWPKEVAPFAVHLISLGKNEEAQQIYSKLVNNGLEVLFDDRDLSAGEKFAEADLVGAPIRMIISAKSIENGGVELIIGDQTEKLSTGEAVDKVIHSLDNIDR
jgi:prolyl-tRNA synthetase